MRLTNKNFGLLITEKYNIAVFLDHPNLEKGINNLDGSQHFEFEWIEKYIRSMGETKILKAYGRFKGDNIAGENLKQYGFELIDTYRKINKTKEKPNTDSKMTLDIIDTYHTRPDINLYIIGSGDIDFTDAILKVKEKPENKVFIISDEHSLNHQYKNIADKVITIQELRRLFEIK